MCRQVYILIKHMNKCSYINMRKDLGGNKYEKDLQD